MNSTEKHLQLKSLINKQLSSFISGEVALFGLPNHGNIGDTFISLGEYEFLKDIKAIIVYERLLIDTSPLPILPDNCTILFQGGGDFGDVWRGIQEERLRIINHYSNHRIVLFPQTVSYHNNNILRNDVEEISNCKDLWICTRDMISYDFVKAHFKHKILLVPDMAFYISPHTMTRPIIKKRISEKTLYLKRQDKELKDFKIAKVPCMDILDWPTINNQSVIIRTSYLLVGITDAFRLRGYSVLSRIFRCLALRYTKSCLYPFILKTGIHFLSSYKSLIVTRLHAAIISTLIGKPYTLVDNSYGKSKNFFHTWLNDLSSATLIEQ